MESNSAADNVDLDRDNEIISANRKINHLLQSDNDDKRDNIDNGNNDLSNEK